MHWLDNENEDPLVVEHQQLLVPQFLNDTSTSPSEDFFESLVHNNKVGRKYYISQYPKLNRPTE